MASYGGEMTRIVEHANRETFLVIQVETPEALAQLPEIASVPGVDGIFYGPADMALRMALQPTEKRVSYEDALGRIAAQAERQGKFWGSMPANLDQMRDLAQRGAHLIPWQNDLALIKQGLVLRSQELDAIYAELRR
ncbi:MAG: hypothetical protein HC915_07070 [Anaerolineae bacterium]|nr:hypothetical protein [Anaerolineae bacterium]